MENQKDNNRSGLNLRKIIQLIKLFHPQNTKTFLRLNEFADLNPDQIAKEKGKVIKGIILDIDDCVAKNQAKILKKNLAHIDLLLSQGIKIVILSNMRKTSRYDILSKKIKVLTNFEPKPAPQGFINALKELNLPKENVVMVGDNYITDGGAIPLKIDFIKIKPINALPPNKLHIIAYYPYKWLRGFYDLLSLMYEKLHLV